MLWDERAESAPSPRPEPPVSALFCQIRRDQLAYDACLRRASNNFATWIAGDRRLHQWLFRPFVCAERGLPPIGE